jgi:2-methylcitrate dehydratase PrpD
LFDGQANWKNGSAEMGRVFQTTRLSHKPFPSGRATHGGVDGALRLQAQHGFAAADVAEVRVATTPLIRDLVGRPIRSDMDVGYAKLCMSYVVATALLTGTVGITDFEDDKRSDPERLALGARVHVVPNDVTDPNALIPQTVDVVLHDGSAFSIELTAVLGHPDRPLERAARLQKFEACCASARAPLDAARVKEFIGVLENLEQLDDARRLVDLSV